MRMPGKSCQIILGIIVAKVVQQQEGIEFFGLAETEGALQLDTGALDGGLGLNHLFDCTERHSSPFYSGGAHIIMGPRRRLIQALMNWTSSVMVTSSPTRIAPVSRAAF